MRNRIKKTLKMILLISICVLGLTGLIIYSVLYNYITKINIIDNAYLVETPVIDYPAPTADKELLSRAASDKTDKQGGYKPSEQKQSDEVYEVYRGFKDQLNMQELSDEEQENDITSGKEQQAASPPDMQAFNNISRSNTAGKVDPNQQDMDKANSSLTQDKEAVGNSQGDKAADVWQKDKAAGTEQDVKAIHEENTKADSAEQEVAEEVEPIIDDKVMNLLLIGQDAKSSDNTSPESFAIFTVNKKAKKLITTTLANNLYLNVPDIGKERLVTAYRIGGAGLLIKTLEKNFGLIIDGYVMADYSAYIDIVDTIGGVELVITKEELDPVNRNIREINRQLGHSTEADIIAGKGRLVLNGKQALGYSRNWYTQKGDLISHGNQKAVVFSILNKVKGFNLIEMNSFLNEVLPRITTNLSEGRILELIVMLPAYFKYGIEYLSLPIQGTEKELRVDSRTVLDYNAKKNISQLHSRLYAMK